MRNRMVKTYLLAMAAFWFVFGLITIFFPPLMDLFASPQGVAAGTGFSDHVWMHGGLDIVSFCIVLVGAALFLPGLTPNMLRAVGLAGFMPVIAIIHSATASPYWTPFFLIPGAGCAFFAIMGFVLARRADPA